MKQARRDRERERWVTDQARNNPSEKSFFDFFFFCFSGKFKEDGKVK